MVARGAGDVGCAHCTQFGARETCQVCGLQVCDTCAADWTTCSEPAGRELRLGMGWRVRDVDPKGRYALVSRMMKGPRIVDLRQLKWDGEAALGIGVIAITHNYPPRLTSDGLLVHADTTWVSQDVAIIGVRYRDMRGGSPNVMVKDDDGPRSCTLVSAVGDKYAYVSETQRVFVIEHSRGVVLQQRAVDVIGHGPLQDPGFRTRVSSYEPLPRKVVSAIAVDGERDVLASATWRDVALDRMVDGKLERIERLDTRIDANITFLALSGRWLVYGTHHALEARRVDHNGAIATGVAHTHRYDGVAALSRDGQYLAIASRGKLIVHDLDRDRVVEYTEHSDDISYIRFASDDHTLISADDDNRVVMRPRTAEGYARPCVKVDLAGEP